MAFRLMRKRPNARNGTITTKDVARAPPMIYAIIMQKMSIRGALIAVLIIIIKDICTFATSVVSRVTRDDVENLSIFSKE